MNRTVTKILVCCHKQCNIPESGILLPIHCGKAVSGMDFGMQGDDTGGNISRKNPNYCELTALYWAWKNLQDTEYIGLYHYRRFFSFKFVDYMHGLSGKKVTVKVKDWSSNKVTDTEIRRILKHNDIILAQPEQFSMSIAEQYISCHSSADLEVARKVISELFPEYLRSFDHIMNNTCRLSECNMFITRWNIFDNYCNWLFNIMSHAEQNMVISDDPYQRRVFGFLAERLLNVYCYHNRLKTAYRPICMVVSQI